MDRGVTSPRAADVGQAELEPAVVLQDVDRERDELEDEDDAGERERDRGDVDIDTEFPLEGTARPRSGSDSFHFHGRTGSDSDSRPGKRGGLISLPRPPVAVTLNPLGTGNKPPFSEGFFPARTSSMSARTNALYIASVNAVFPRRAGRRVLAGSTTTEVYA